MSRPLQNITKALIKTNSALEQLQKTTKKSTKFAQDLATAKQKVAAAELNIRNAINQSTQAQQKFNRAMKASLAVSKQASNASSSNQSNTTQQQNQKGGLFNKITSAAAKYGLQGAKTAIIGAAEQQQILDTYIARTGSEAHGQAIYDQITQQALKYGQDVNAAHSAAMANMSITNDPKQLTELNGLAMRLSQLNPAEGFEGAAASIKELMKGDASSIADNFNISSSAVEGSDAYKAALAGDVEGFIQGMDQLLNQQNMTQEAFEKMMDTPAVKWNILVGEFNNNLGRAGEDALKIFSPVLDLLINAFESGELNAFFAAFSLGLAFAAKGIAILVQGALWLWQVISTHWLEIGAMLIPAIIVALWSMAASLWSMIPTLWSMVAPIVAQAIAWLAAYWPLLLIMEAIGLIIYILLQLGVTAGQIVGVIGGVFGVLFGYLKNIFAYFWNYLLSFVEFFVNIFNDPVYAVQKLFFDLVKNIVEFFGGLINSIIGGLNKLIQAANSVTGKNIQLIGTVDTSAIDKYEPKSNAKVWDASKYRMQQTDLGDAYNRGKDTASNFLNQATETLKNFKLDTSQDYSGSSTNNWANGSNINRVNEVGSINDSVDVSSEDLEVMRELAEMQNIQNFVSLTPTVQVTTGPVNNGYDINTIISRIENKLEEEFVNSAKGVYGY